MRKLTLLDAGMEAASLHPIERIAFGAYSFSMFRRYKYLSIRSGRGLTVEKKLILNVLSTSEYEILAKVLPRFLDTTADVPIPAKHRSLIAVSHMRYVRDAMKLQYTLAVQTMILSVSTSHRHRRELKMINSTGFNDPVIVISSVQNLLHDVNMERVGKIVFLGTAANMPSNSPERLSIESMLYREAA